MGKIYTISPFILSDSIPKNASIPSIISDYFYLFKIFSGNPYVVKYYMQFIDANFDFAFSKMKLTMVEYEYPDDRPFMTDISDIVNYINNEYHLTGDWSLERCYYPNKYEVYDFTTDKEITLYFNDYAAYDTAYLGKGIFDYDMDVLGELLPLIKYLKADRDLIKAVVHTMYNYMITLPDYLNETPDNIYMGMFSEPLVILAQLKSFVKYTLKKRVMEENGEDVYY